MIALAQYAGMAFAGAFFIALVVCSIAPLWTIDSDPSAHFDPGNDTRRHDAGEGR